jgi:hypothetical protein
MTEAAYCADILDFVSGIRQSILIRREGGQRKTS